MKAFRGRADCGDEAVEDKPKKNAAVTAEELKDVSLFLPRNGYKMLEVSGE